MTAPAYRVVAGLTIPEVLVEPMIEAFRGSYGSITDEIEDGEAAVRAVLKHLATQIFVEYFTQKAAETAAAKVSAAQAAAETAVLAARQQAIAATTAVTDGTTGSLDSPG